MTSQKDHLLRAAQDFSLIDQCFPRHHQHTEAGLGPIMGWTTTTSYPENGHHLRPPALRVLLAPVITIKSSSDDVMKSTDHVLSGRRISYQAPPAAASKNKCNFGGWPFVRYKEYRQIK
ncbi:hypothetical protein SLA2020_508380 [Shorea laevis]